MLCQQLQCWRDDFSRTSLHPFQTLRHTHHPSLATSPNYCLGQGKDPVWWRILLTSPVILLPSPPPQKWITSEVLNQAKSIFWSSEEWKGRDRELKQGQALALALEAQRHKSAFSWVTGEAQGMQHGSSELEANPNKGSSSLLLDSLLRNCSYRRGTNKIFCKIPLPMLLCLFYFIFFPDSKKNPKCSPRWKENMDNVTEQIGSTCYILVPLHLSLT